MTLVRRSEPDMMRLYPLSDVMVNPTNLIGTMDGGLASVFKERWPDMADAYRRLCDAKEMTIGRLFEWKPDVQSPSIINLPTKRHWVDDHDPDDLRRTLSRFREYLMDPARRFWTVSMPMLGITNDPASLDTAEVLMNEYLGDLPNLIHVCIAPHRLPREPRYLAVIGGRDLFDYDYVKEFTLECLDKWGMVPPDFDGIVSGGAPGVDDDACGKHLDKAGNIVERLDACLASDWRLKPVVCYADWKRYYGNAGHIRNRQIVDIAQYIVAIPSTNSKGTYDSVRKIMNWNQSDDVPEEKKKKFFVAKAREPVSKI